MSSVCSWITFQFGTNSHQVVGREKKKTYLHFKTRATSFSGNKKSPCQTLLLYFNFEEGVSLLLLHRCSVWREKEYLEQKPLFSAAEAVILLPMRLSFFLLLWNSFLQQEVRLFSCELMWACCFSVEKRSKTIKFIFHLAIIWGKVILLPRYQTKIRAS